MKRSILISLAGLALLSACGDQATNPSSFLTPQSAEPRFHVAGEDGPATAHTGLLPVVTGPAAEATVNAGSVTVAWNVGTGAGGETTTRYRFKLECSGTGCSPISTETIARSGTATTAQRSAILTQGTYTASVRGEFTTGSGTLHASNWATRTFYVTAAPPPKQAQTITFTIPAGFQKQYGTGDVDLSDDDNGSIGTGIRAYSSSSLPLTFASLTSSICSIVNDEEGNGNFARIDAVGDGTCRIRATQAGNASFDAAAPVEQSFTVVKAPLTVTATATPDTKMYDGTGFDPSSFAVRYGTLVNDVLENSFVNGEDKTVLGGTLSFVVNPPAGATYTYPDAGTYSLVPSGLTSSNYAITFVNATLTINKADQTITFGSLSNKTYGDAPFEVSASGGGSGNPVTFTSAVNSVGCSVATDSDGKTTVTITGATPVGQSCIVNADQAGNNNYNPATTVSQSFSIAKANLTISVIDASSVQYNKSIYFGETVAAASLDFSGFVNNDGPLSIGSPTVVWCLGSVCSATTPSAVGTYQATSSVTTTANYEVTLNAGSLTIRAWSLKGFYQPVDMSPVGGPIVYNTVKSGSTVPFKFEIFAGPTELTAVASVSSFLSAPISCALTAALDDIESTTTGGTSLRYDATGGQFIQNWQTTGKAGSCYKVTMTTMDGSSLVAYFKLK